MLVAGLEELGQVDKTVREVDIGVVDRMPSDVYQVAVDMADICYLGYWLGHRPVVRMRTSFRGLAIVWGCRKVQRWCVLVLLCMTVSTTVWATDPVPKAPATVHFIENKRQWHASILFGAPVDQGYVTFQRDKLQFLFEGKRPRPAKGIRSRRRAAHEPVADDGHHPEPATDGHVVDVTFVGANPLVYVAGEEKIVTQYNFLLGNDPSHWASRAAAYSRVRYHDLYCGIDLVYGSQEGRMKYEWIVSPQQDPSVIALQYTGADEISIMEENVYIRTSINEVWELKPYAYQNIQGRRIPVSCRYTLHGQTVGYDFPEGYNPAYTLVIDPVLVFSGYSGSKADNWGFTATYDAKSNAYSGGIVRANISLQYPTTSGAYKVDPQGGRWDVGIMKFDSAGTALLYCTYLGGEGVEIPQSLVVNHAGELLILGVTSSFDFPVNNGSTFKVGTGATPVNGITFAGGADLFVAKLSEDGSELLAGTFLGGAGIDGINLDPVELGGLNRNYGDALRGDIITDANDFVYLTTSTRTVDFPVVGTGSQYAGGSQDGVLVKLRPDLSTISWSRFIGTSNVDAAYSLKLDKSGHVFVAGGTGGRSLTGVTGFRTETRGGIDGWVMSFMASTGAVVNGTMLGTMGDEQCYFVDLDQDDNVYLFGQTTGPYPISKRQRVYYNPNAGQFIQKLSNNLRDTLMSTVIGNGGFAPDISPTAFQVNECGFIYLSGWGGDYNGTTTEGLPTTPDAYQRESFGHDFYFMSLTSDMRRLAYGTFLGGSISPTHVDGGTSRFDKRGVVYHAVCAGCPACDGCPSTSDFPWKNVPTAHRANGSTNCNNAVFKLDLSQLKAAVQTNTVALDLPGVNKICRPDKIVFENMSFGGTLYEWDLGDGTKFTTTNTNPVIHEYKESNRRYTVWLKAIAPGTCKGVDSVSVYVDVFDAFARIQDDDALCAGTEYTIEASGAAVYSWRSADGTFTSTEPSPVVKPADTTVYYLEYTEVSGCVGKDTVQLDVVQPIGAEFTLERITDCFSQPTLHVVNLTDSLVATDQVYFELGDGTKSDQAEFTHHYQDDGTYTVKLLGIRQAGNKFCVTEQSTPVDIFTLKVPNVITPDATPGQNDTFVIQYGQAPGVSPRDVGYPVAVKIFNRWGNLLYESDDYKNDWAGSNLASGTYFFEVTVQHHATCKGWVQLLR
jgi:gliding motility-associated-like protein